MSLRAGCLLLLLCLLFAHAWGQTAKSLWVYHEEEGRFLCCTEFDEVSSPVRKVGFPIYANKWCAGCFAELRVPGGTSIFADGHLVVHVEQADTVILEAWRIKRYLANKDSLFVSALNEKGFGVAILGYGLKNADGNAFDPFKKFVVTSPFVEVPRQKEAHKPFVVIGLLLLMTYLGVLLRRFPKISEEYFDVLRAVSSRARDGAFFKLRLFERASWLFLLFISELIAFLTVLLIIALSRPLQFINFYFPQVELLWPLELLIWQVLAVFVFFLFLLKYFFVRQMSALFVMKDWFRIHFFDSVRLSLLFHLLVSSVVVILYLFEGYDITSWNSVVFAVFCTFWGMRALLLYFKVGSYTPFRKLYLFSYLCTTEIIPLLYLIERLSGLLL